ncbi:hypothetical protein [Mesorhizobium sanjuanii]|nr:hypothetical protein [Mesorhizobium sanjuanii]
MIPFLASRSLRPRHVGTRFDGHDRIAGVPASAGFRNVSKPNR